MAAGEPQALPTRWPGPASLGVADTFPTCCVTAAQYTELPHIPTHRCTGRHTQADRHAQEGGHTNTSKQKNTEDTAPKNIGKDRQTDVGFTQKDGQDDAEER